MASQTIMNAKSDTEITARAADEPNTSDRGSVAREVLSLRQPRDNDVTTDRAAIHIDSTSSARLSVQSDSSECLGVVRSCMP